MIETDESLLPASGSLREMLAIALPMVVSHGCETVMIFTDRLFLSQLGSVPMNAALVGGLTSYMLMTFFAGLVGYATALVAQYLGARRHTDCALVVTQALLICLAAFPLILATVPLIHQLFALMDIAPVQLIAQKQYFDLLVYGTIFSLLRTVFSSFFSGVGRTRVVMLAALVAMTINVGANYVLIFGHLGIPALGLRGAACGTIFANLCGLLVLAALYLKRENRQGYQVRQSLRFDARVMGKLLRYGSPAGGEMFLNLLAFTLMILIFHGSGLVTATAITLVFNWDLVSFIPLIGIQVAVVSLVGRYMGAQQPEIAARVTHSGLKMAMFYSSLILLLFASCPAQLIAIFEPAVSDPIFAQARPLAVSMLRLAAFYVLADAMMVVFSGALRGAGDTFWTMCLSVGMHWLLVLVLWGLLKVAGFSALTAWMTLVLFFLVFCGLFYLRYRSGKWKTLVVVDATD